MTLFEALHGSVGGLVHGIPEFRLPKEVVRFEIENLTRVGVELRSGFVIGVATVILAMGAGKQAALGIHEWLGKLKRGEVTKPALA